MADAPLPDPRPAPMPVEPLPVLEIRSPDAWDPPVPCSIEVPPGPCPSGPELSDCHYLARNTGVCIDVHEQDTPGCYFIDPPQCDLGLGEDSRCIRTGDGHACVHGIPSWPRPGT